MVQVWLILVGFTHAFMVSKWVRTGYVFDDHGSHRSTYNKSIGQLGALSTWSLLGLSSKLLYMVSQVPKATF